MTNVENKRFLLTALLVLSLAFCLAIAGCGGGETGKTEEDSTLPEDMGDKTLLDTAAYAEMEAPEETKPEPPKEEPKARPKPKPKEPEIIKVIVVPTNSILKVEMVTKISTGENNIGDKFQALYLEPGEEGVALDIPAGTIFEGFVEDIGDGKAEDEKAFIKLKFTNMLIPGESPLTMEGYILNKEGDGYLRPGGQGTTIAKDAGIGAVAGAVLGGILGKKGDKNKTAVKGAAAGVVIGGIAGAVLHKDQVTLKEGAKFNIGIVTNIIKSVVK